CQKNPRVNARASSVGWRVGEASYRTPRTRLWSAQACLRLDLRQLAVANWLHTLAPALKPGKLGLTIVNGEGATQSECRSSDLGPRGRAALTGGAIPCRAFGPG